MQVDESGIIAPPHTSLLTERMGIVTNRLILWGVTWKMRIFEWRNYEHLSD